MIIKCSKRIRKYFRKNLPQHKKCGMGKRHSQRKHNFNAYIRKNKKFQTNNLNVHLGSQKKCKLKLN